MRAEKTLIRTELEKTIEDYVVLLGWQTRSLWIGGIPKCIDKDKFVHAPTFICPVRSGIVTEGMSRCCYFVCTTLHRIGRPESKPCLRKSSQKARRFFFAANAARVMFPS